MLSLCSEEESSECTHQREQLWQLETDARPACTGCKQDHSENRDHSLVPHTALSSKAGDMARPNLWHHRFGHLNDRSLRHLQQHNMVAGLEGAVQDMVPANCVGCLLGKQHRNCIPKLTCHSQAAGETGTCPHRPVWSDECGQSWRETLSSHLHRRLHAQGLDMLSDKQSQRFYTALNSS